MVFTQDVSEEQLRKLILAGTKAPSGSNIQPSEFIIIDDLKIIGQIVEYKYQQTLEKSLSLQSAVRQRDAYRNCAVVAVCNKKGHGIGRKPWMRIEKIASSWMCVENIALAATADGLGLVTSILREEHKVAVEKLLEIPEDYELTTIV